MIGKTIMIRKRQREKIYNKYYNDYQDFKKFILENGENENTINSGYLSLEDIYCFQYNTTSDKDSIKKMIENLPILSSDKEFQLYKLMKYDSKECKDYLDTLVHTTHYYFNECINWRYSSTISKGPLLTHLCKYIVSYKINIEKDNNEYSNLEQLSYIFPKDSHHLHEYDIIGKEYKIIVDLNFNRYLWECHLNFV